MAWIVKGNVLWKPVSMRPYWHRTTADMSWAEGLDRLYRKLCPVISDIIYEREKKNQINIYINAEDECLRCCKYRTCIVASWRRRSVDQRCVVEHSGTQLFQEFVVFRRQFGGLDVKSGARWRWAIGGDMSQFPTLETLPSVFITCRCS